MRRQELSDAEGFGRTPVRRAGGRRRLRRLLEPPRPRFLARQVECSIRGRGSTWRLRLRPANLLALLEPTAPAGPGAPNFSPGARGATRGEGLAVARSGAAAPSCAGWGGLEVFALRAIAIFRWTVVWGGGWRGCHRVFEGTAYATTRKLPRGTAGAHAILRGEPAARAGCALCRRSTREVEIARSSAARQLLLGPATAETSAGAPPTASPQGAPPAPAHPLRRLGAAAARLPDGGFAASARRWCSPIYTIAGQPERDAPALKPAAPGRPRSCRTRPRRSIRGAESSPEAAAGGRGGPQDGGAAQFRNR